MGKTQSSMYQLAKVPYQGELGMAFFGESMYCQIKENQVKYIDSNGLWPFIVFASKCAISSRLRGRGVGVGLPTLLCKVANRSKYSQSGRNAVWE